MDLIQQGLEVFVIFYVLISIIFTTAFIIKVIKTIILANRMSKMLNDVKCAMDNIKLVRVEDSGPRVMMYDLMTEHFICWADSREELWESAQRLFPDIEIIEAPKQQINIEVN